ncbi:UNVERIFIED_CONTAM: hypothetical protein RMT77_019389 [Armadillidium vulgare]
MGFLLVMFLSFVSSDLMEYVMERAYITFEGCLSECYKRPKQSFAKLQQCKEACRKQYPNTSFKRQTH